MTSHSPASSPELPDLGPVYIPAGYVLVPREPTVAMILAGAGTRGMKAIDDSCTTMQLRGYPLDPAAFEDGAPLAQAWRAMIDAAPSTADLVAHETPNASDNGACVQPASGEVAVGAAAQLDAMVTAYLEANDAYWRKTDGLPIRPGEWRAGTAREATRVSLLAALAATPASPQAPAPQAAPEGWLPKTYPSNVHGLISDAEYLKLFDEARKGSDKPCGTIRGIRAVIAAYETAAPSASPHQGADALREIEALADEMGEAFMELGSVKSKYAQEHFIPQLERIARLLGSIR